MHVRSISGDRNWVEIQCGTENENWLAGHSVQLQVIIEKNYLLPRAGSSVWGVLTGLLLT